MDDLRTIRHLGITIDETFCQEINGELVYYFRPTETFRQKLAEADMIVISVVKAKNQAA